MTWNLDLLWQLRRPLWRIPGKDSDPGNSEADWQHTLFPKVDRALQQQRRVVSPHLATDCFGSHTDPWAAFNKPVLLNCAEMFFQAQSFFIYFIFSRGIKCYFLFPDHKCRVRIGKRTGKQNIKATQVPNLRANLSPFISNHCAPSLWQAIILIKLTMPWWWLKEKIIRIWS